MIGSKLPWSFFFQLFADKDILFAGQPVGIIVATSQHLANKAAKKVKVNVSNVKKPLLTTQEVLDSGDQSRVKFVDTIERKVKKGMYLKI